MKKKIICLLMAVLLAAGVMACTPKSAYDVAVENGFVGTEAEWLQSLKGTDGKNGENANEINIYDIYESYKELHPDVSFEEFLQQYLTVEYNNTEYAANLAARSVVGIESQFVDNKNKAFYAAGSGVIYKLNEEGYTYIISNYHVIYDSASKNGIAEQIVAYTYGSFDTIELTFVGGSIIYDIAVLKAEEKYFRSSALAQVALADTASVSVGQPAIAVGNPRGSGIAVTSGVVSVDSEYIDMDALDGSADEIKMRVIRVDTPINGGNSGGGLFNKKGELLGIVNAKIVDEAVENIGYAIPSNVAIGIVQNILSNGTQKIKKILIGITTQIQSSMAVYDAQSGSMSIVEEMEVIEIANNSIARGKLAVGDVMQSAALNDQEPITLTRNYQLSDYLYFAKVGDVLTLKVQRGALTITVELTFTSSNITTID